MHDYIDPLRKYRQLLGPSFILESHLERTLGESDRALRRLGLLPTDVYEKPLIGRLFSTSLAELFKPQTAMAELFKLKPIADHLAAIDARWRAAHEPLLGAGKLASLAESISRAQQLSLRGGVAAVGAFSASPTLRSLEPVLDSHSALARFAQLTSTAAVAADGRQLHAYSLSLDLAGVQTQLLNEYCAEVARRLVNTDVRNSRPTANLFAWEQRQLVEDPELDEDEDVEGLLSTGRPRASHTFRLSARLARLLAEIQEDEHLEGSRPTFPLTTQIFSATVGLHTLVAHDRATFAELVRGLYMIFYEGAGANALRYLKASGGPLEEGECEAVWITKCLRNRWLQHDVEHGSTRARERGREDLGEALASLGQTGGMPRTAEEYYSLQIRLLEKFCDMTQLMLDRRRG